MDQEDQVDQVDLEDLVDQEGLKYLEDQAAREVNNITEAISVYI